MECSIIIVTHNSADDIVECVESVLDQSFDREYEVLIADNGSTDGTPDIVRQRFSNRLVDVRVIELGHNYGAGGGGNRALGYANGKFIANLDPDTTVHRDWLRNLHRTIRETGIAAVHSCIFEPYHPEFYGLDREEYPDQRVLFDFTPFGFIDDHVVNAEPVDTLHVPGGAMMIDRSIAEDLDYLFDEEIPFPCDDLELGLRLNARGETVRFSPDAIVYHRQYQKGDFTDVTHLIEKYISYMEGRSNAFYKVLSTDEYVRFLPRLYVGYVLNVRVLRMSPILKSLGYPAAAALGAVAFVKSLLSNRKFREKRRRILSNRRRDMFHELKRLRPDYGTESTLKQ